MKTSIKILIICCVWIGSQFGVIELKGQIPSGKKLHRVEFYETIDRWRKCEMQNARILEESNSVIFFSGDKISELKTDVINAGFPYDHLILSWNATRPDSISIIQFDVEVSNDSTHWTMFDYQTWGTSPEIKKITGGVGELAGVGKIETDYLVLQKPMRYARVIVRVIGRPGSSNIILRRLSVSISSTNSSLADHKTYHVHSSERKIEKVRLAVPYFSQRNLPDSISGDCCSPTSVSMVLNYHGMQCTAEQVAHAVYDPRGKMFGNWPQNVAAAFNLGLGKTWVESHCTFDELYDEVADGKPVVISIAFGYDELPRSPIHEAAEGHLIAVVGFDGPDIVVCNDPAGHNVNDGIVAYPRHELEKVWIAHGGIAYHLWPE